MLKMLRNIMCKKEKKQISYINKTHRYFNILNENISTIKYHSMIKLESSTKIL